MKFNPNRREVMDEKRYWVQFKTKRYLLSEVNYFKLHAGEITIRQALDLSIETTATPPKEK